MISDALRDVDQFITVVNAEPHINRARAILKAHPEVRALIGPAPSTFFLTLALVAAQIAIALALRDASPWSILLAAYTIGALINCAVLNMVHEASHNLIFRSRRWNRVTAYIANLGTFWPSVETFFAYHLPHHRHLGVYEHDTTVPRAWEAKLIGRGPIRKTLWFLFFAMIYPFRVKHMHVDRGPNRRILFNLGFQIIWWVILFRIGGLTPLVYLLLSFYFHFGLHPLNAIALQEHIYVRRGCESYSYYGFANWLTFNAGYHVEHHDLPSIPWSRIRRLRQIAPEFYDDRPAYHSWTKLMVRFILDKRWSLWARAVRTNATTTSVSRVEPPTTHMVGDSQGISS